MDKEWLETLLKINQKKKLVSHIISIECEPAVAKGENFASLIQRYKVQLALNNGKKILKHFIVKTPPTVVELAGFCLETPIFKNEIFIYSIVTKEMEELMKEYNDKREKMWCKLIGYREYDKVILEDLKEKKFDVMNRTDMLDFEHSQLAVRSIGRYHAMSVILLKRAIIRPEDFDTLLFVSNKQMIDMFFVSFFSVFSDVVREKWEPKWSVLSERLKKAGESAFGRLRNMVKYNEANFNVINHGDCWTNNLMFKHAVGTNIPTEIRFIDYQMSHCNSFAWDLTYLFYNSTRPDLRRTRYNELLSAYHKSLKETLLLYDYPKEDIPNFDFIYKEMERLKFFGFCLLISIHAFTSTEVPNSYDLFSAYEDKKNQEIAINPDIFTSKKFRHKIEDDIHNFMEEGLI